MTNKLLQLVLALIFLFVTPNGVIGGGRCHNENSDLYKCGHDKEDNSLAGTNPRWTETCSQNQCCCPHYDGWDYENIGIYQLTACENMWEGGLINYGIKRYISTIVGCYACTGHPDEEEDGVQACSGLTNSEIGDYSCRGYKSCSDSNYISVGRYACQHQEACSIGKYNNFVDIGDYSCDGLQACNDIEGRIDGPMKIGNNSCQGKKACKNLASDYSSTWLRPITIDNDSCQGDNACKGYTDDYKVTHLIIGRNACVGEDSCKFGDYLTVGNDSCNSDNSCSRAIGMDLKHIKIGARSCNAYGICAGCEAGSKVPSDTCNDLDNEDEVGIGSDGEKRCRACYAELLSPTTIPTSQPSMSIIPSTSMIPSDSSSSTPSESPSTSDWPTTQPSESPSHSGVPSSQPSDSPTVSLSPTTIRSRYMAIGKGTCINADNYSYAGFSFNQYRANFDAEITMTYEVCHSKCMCVEDEVARLGLGSIFWGMEYNPSVEYLRCQCDVSRINDQADQRAIIDACQGDSIDANYFGGYGANSKIVSSYTQNLAWLIDTTCYALEVQGDFKASKPTRAPAKSTAKPKRAKTSKAKGRKKKNKPFKSRKGKSDKAKKSHVFE